MRTPSKKHKPILGPYMTERLFELRLEGKHPIVHGKELSFKGEPGRFRFKWARETTDGFEITVYGGTTRRQAYRTFMADRIKAVHYKEKLRK